MNTATAATVTAGQTVKTIASIGSGRTSTSTFTVTEVESFSIRGIAFVEMFHNGGSFTTAASNLVELV